MITPFDIEKKEFSKGVRGYSVEEVDEFLDQIIVDMEKVIKENLRLKAEIAALEQENEKYKGSEGEVLQVLEQAKGLMQDISVSAEKRAEVILKNAELDAELTVREARARAERLKDENESLEKRYVAFRNRYKKYLEDELERFDSLDDGLFPFDDQRLEELVKEPVNRSVLTEEEPNFFLAEEQQREDDERKTLILHPRKGSED